MSIDELRRRLVERGSLEPELIVDRLLAPAARDVLTLYTCYPFGRGPSSPLRFVVRAVALPNEDSARATATQQ